MEFVQRFMRLAARYEEEYLGTTKIGYPSCAFSAGMDGYGQLGSGLSFSEDAAIAKELAFNANRIEGWRRSKMYELYAEV